MVDGERLVGLFHKSTERGRRYGRYDKARAPVPHQTANSEHQEIKMSAKHQTAPEAHGLSQPKATNSIRRRKDTNKRDKVKMKGVRVIVGWNPASYSEAERTEFRGGYRGDGASESESVIGNISESGKKFPSISTCSPTWTAQTPKLWNELSNVISGRVSLDWLLVYCSNLFTLVIRVEYSEVGLRNRPGSCAPLPASIVRGEVSISEYL
jgi:hypothetical protein